MTDVRHSVKSESVRLKRFRKDDHIASAKTATSEQANTLSNINWYNYRAIAIYHP